MVLLLLPQHQHRHPQQPQQILLINARNSASLTYVSNCAPARFLSSCPSTYMRGMICIISFFEKTDCGTNAQKISESTCLSNCQVIDGQVQVNAPGKAFPPVREATASSSATAALPSVAVNVVEKACEATCELGSKSIVSLLDRLLRKLEGMVRVLMLRREAERERPMIKCKQV
ncbi:MAG: hypothetical protein Q9188_003677 [Gyalolechia gomerana]